MGPIIAIPDNKFLIFGSQNRSIEVFDNETKQQTHHFKEVHQGKFAFLSAFPHSFFISHCVTRSDIEQQISHFWLFGSIYKNIKSQE